MGVLRDFKPAANAPPGGSGSFSFPPSWPLTAPRESAKAEEEDAKPAAAAAACTARGPLRAARISLKTD